VITCSSENKFKGELNGERAIKGEHTIGIWRVLACHCAYISLYTNLFAQVFVSTGFQIFPHYEVTTVVTQHCLHTRAGKPCMWMLLSHHISTLVVIGADVVCTNTPGGHYSQA
jgi:hypothetical protein